MHRNQWEQHVSEQWILPSIDEKKKTDSIHYGAEVGQR